jgi:hypothetical protein
VCGFSRLGTIFVGFLAGCIAAAVGSGIAIGADVHPLILLLHLINSFAIAAFPMLLLAFLTEGFGIRSIWLYLGVGAAIALLPLLRAPLVETAGSLVNTQSALMMLSGAIGGLIYWVIAGRRAGDWPVPAAT